MDGEGAIPSCPADADPPGQAIKGGCIRYHSVAGSLMCGKVKFSLFSGLCCSCKCDCWFFSRVYTDFRRIIKRMQESGIIQRGGCSFNIFSTD